MADDVTTERFGDWSVEQCGELDRWAVTVSIDVAPPAGTETMTDEDRAVLSELATQTVASVRRYLETRSVCEEEPAVVASTQSGAGPWTLEEPHATGGVGESTSPPPDEGA
jgi:hypothetical protein